MSKNVLPPDRRTVLAVAAGAVALLPTDLAAAGAARSSHSSLQGDSHMCTTEAEAIRPFSFHAPQSELDDLRRRVAAARLPEKELVSDFSQGVPLATVQKIARYWATEYDWRKV